MKDELGCRGKEWAEQTQGESRYEFRAGNNKVLN